MHGHPHQVKSSQEVWNYQRLGRVRFKGRRPLSFFEHFASKMHYKNHLQHAILFGKERRDTIRNT